MSELPEKRNIVLGITGSIAAYKAAELARLFISRGYQVRVVMTESAQEFIAPLTFESLTGFPVVTGFWDRPSAVEIEHIELAQWADAVVIAPGTANLIAKLVAGLADDPLAALYLSTRAPFLIAPAMNCNMLEHPKTRENIEILKQRGVHFVDSEEGELACGVVGTGRLANSWEIFYNVRRLLTQSDFSGKRILITTGPTREPIDPVRFVTNRSSGKMGIALAQEAFVRGAEVTLIHGAVPVAVPRAIRCIPVLTATDMLEAVLKNSFDAEQLPDAIIMAAAVSDFKPKESAEEKIKKADVALQLELERNPDILQELGQRKGGESRPILVGFAVETGELEDLLVELRRKLESKQADLMVGNFAEDAFGLDTNRVWLMNRNGRYSEVATTFKSRVANRILDVVAKL